MVDVNREAVRILEEVVSCRADVDAKCGGIKGQAVCGTAEAGILEGFVGDVEEELLLHVHARALALADAKVRLIEGRCVVEEVPVEVVRASGVTVNTAAKSSGSNWCRKCGFIARQASCDLHCMSVSLRAGRPLVLPGACRPMPMTAMGSNAAALFERSGLGLGAQVGDVGCGWEVRPHGSASACPWGRRCRSK